MGPTVLGNTACAVELRREEWQENNALRASYRTAPLTFLVVAVPGSHRSLRTLWGRRLYAGIGFRRGRTE
ncbi:hypothetical protein HNQ04_000433 [Deinococcus radiopugnans ATCC 19172]|uniref:Uncharacterized protein n=1 Tax=Deinococcus radiopugnans ATCC 19172 TaxID=585398 RepID=A0ABR6NP37_9DEIO|nr:hypothetical protein [Deinococcus radiopugnans ATCC 19172]